MLKDMDKYLEEYKRDFIEAVEKRAKTLQEVEYSIKELKLYNQDYQNLLDSILPMITNKNYEAILFLGQRLEDDLKEKNKPNLEILKKLMKDYSLIFQLVPLEITRDYFGNLEKKINNKS